MKKINGFSLIEVSVALVISAIVLGGIISTLSIVNKGNAQYNLAQARNEIVNKIKTHAMNLSNLAVSADVTQSIGAAGLSPDYGPPSVLGFPNLLKTCMPDLNNTTFGCDKTTIEEVGRGYLFYLTENTIKDPEKTVAGEDVYYKNTGMRCTSTEAANVDLCPLQARVWFEPFCLNFASQCNKAMSVTIRYLVGIRSDNHSDISLSDLNGELYVPLQKGIQIRNLLSQSNSPISPNSKGIFVVPKYYGYPLQLIEGLRLEASVMNPSGLISMRIQGRSLTGTDAKLYDDSKIPPELLKKTWEDIPTPDNPGLGVWAIDLTGATPNQTFNFGTQLNVNAESRPPISFLIGKTKSGTPDPTYHWTLNADSSDYIPPEFKSGFYQFKIIATDSNGNELDSSNYLTVRLVGTPEYQFVNENLNLTRDCVTTTKSYSIYVGDDEQISYNQLKVNDSIVATPTIMGNKGLLNFDFLVNQSSANYPINLILKNQFSDVVLETLTVPKLDITKIINLIEVGVGSNISNNPDKIRITKTATIALSFTAGNCCNATPKATWSFLTSPFFGGAALLAESTTNSYADLTSNMTCSVAGSSRICSTSFDARGMKEGPIMSSPPNDISAQLDLGTEASNSACQFSSTNPSGDPVAKYIPVVALPSIRFYLTESLWLHSIPPGPATSGLQPTAIKPVIPRVYVRMDFAPDHDVEVYVVDSLNPTLALCPPITFVADGGTTPIDKICDINSKTFSGVLELRRKDDNPLTPFNKIMYEGEITCPFGSCDAKFAGTTHHTICQRDFTNPAETSINKVPMPTQFVVPADKQMIDSPFGILSGGAQNSKNDFKEWITGRQKLLRCYDNWRQNNNTAYAYNEPFNDQDYYSLYKYNTETLVSITPQPPPRQFRIQNFSSPSPNSITFQNFNYPKNNGGLDYSADNIPFMYMVSQHGTPESIRWSGPWVSSGSSISSGVQAWEDVTSGLNCNGLSNNLKLFRIRPNVNWNTSTSTLNAISGAVTAFIDDTDRYSYLFMCDYGRWNPSTPNNTNWVD